MPLISTYSEFYDIPNIARCNIKFSQNYEFFNAAHRVFQRFNDHIDKRIPTMKYLNATLGSLPGRVITVATREIELPLSPLVRPSYQHHPWRDHMVWIMTPLEEV